MKTRLINHFRIFCSISYQQSRFSLTQWVFKLIFGLFVRIFLNASNTLGCCNYAPASPSFWNLTDELAIFKHRMYPSVKIANGYNLCSLSHNMDLFPMSCFFFCFVFCFKLDIPHRSKDNKCYISSGLFSSCAE